MCSGEVFRIAVMTRQKRPEISDGHFSEIIESANHADHTVIHMTGALLKALYA